MPKTSDKMVSATRKRSVRQKPAKKEPLTVAQSTVLHEEVQMPPGYNPSDDSEEEYVPPAKKTKISLTRTKRSRKQTSGSDSEPKEEENQKPKKRGRKSKSAITNPQNNTSTSKATKKPQTVSETLNTSPSLVTKIPQIAKAETLVKTEQDQHILCPFQRCNEKLKIEGNARFHLSLHYYDAGKFSEKDIFTPEDPDKNGKAMDDKAPKYSCRYDRCTKRRMGYKEMCVHLATQHQMLEGLMVDGNHEIQRIRKILYPNLNEPEVKVKVKSEPIQPEADQEDPDDPDDPSAKVTPAPSKVKPLVSEVVSQTVMPVIQRPRVERIMNCFLCKEKDGRNMSGQQNIKYHMSVCAYGTEYWKYVPHHQGTDKVKITDLDELGSLWRYRCTFEGCDKNSGRAKSLGMGYKEFAIHLGFMHGVLERWAEDNEMEGTKELFKTLKGWREAEGKQLPDLPEVKVEEMHICYICNGADKEGKNLSLAPEKINSTRYHYANCLYVYGSKVYYEIYNPSDQDHEENKNPDGSPRDIMGREYGYKCFETAACSNRKRKMGYREWAIHQANEHKGLEKVLENHKDERVRKLIPRLARR